MKALRITLCQLKPSLGNARVNADAVIQCSLQYPESDLLVFPELFLSGYHPRDLLTHKTFLETCAFQLDRIQSQIQTPVLVGAPYREGESLYNGAFFISRHRKQVFKKHHLPFYDVFDEPRYFSEGKGDPILELNGYRLLVSICEDLWGEVEPFPHRYKKDLSLFWKSHRGVDALVNLSASPYHQDVWSRRLKVLQSNCSHLNLPLIYVNNVGQNEEILFDGRSVVMDREGDVCVKAKSFEEQILSVSLSKSGDLIDSPEEDLEKKFSKEKIAPLEKEEESLLTKAILFGIREYTAQMGFKRTLLGISGGIDSSVTAALLVQALGANNVLGFALPSPYTSETSMRGTRDLCDNLGISLEIVPISPAFEVVKKSLEKGENPLKSITEENIQARLRMLFLMAKTTETQSVLVNCSNKSEMAMGYSTLYGDLSGAFSPLGDLYKTEIYALARYLNRQKPVIPPSILEREPTAELKTGQKDSDELPPYPILDAILFALIEQGTPVETLCKECPDRAALIKKVALRVQMSEFKRFQAPPIFKLSAKAFGVGRRISLSHPHTLIDH